MTRSTPSLPDLTEDLRLLVRVGLRRGLAHQLDDLASLQSLLPADVPLQQAPVVLLRMLTNASSRLDQARYGRAAGLLLGLTPATRDQPLNVRRRMAADAIRKAPSTFRASYEQRVVEAVAWELLDHAIESEEGRPLDKAAPGGDVSL